MISRTTIATTTRARTGWRSAKTRIVPEGTRTAGTSWACLTARHGTPQARAVESGSGRRNSAPWWRRPEVLDVVVPVVLVRVALLVVGALAGGLLGSPPEAAPPD